MNAHRIVAAAWTMLLGSAPAALGQIETGAFVAPSNWGVGVAFSNGNLLIDTDADPALETYPLTVPQLVNNAASVQFLLSPDRSVVYARAFGSALTGLCDPTDNQIYFFRVVQDNDAGGHLETILNGGLCINGPLPDEDGLFERPGRLRHVAFIVEAKDMPSSTTQTIHWIDLNGVDERGSTNLTVDIEAISLRFAPDGIVALVKHDVGNQPMEADYTLVDLCPVPRLGDPVTSQVGGPLFNLGQPNPTASMIEDPPGTFKARIMHPDIQPSGVFDAVITPCEGGPVSGACCDGGCTVTDQASCGGTFFAGDTCSPDPCDMEGTEGCCLDATGECVEEFPDDCLTMGGTPQGTGSDCSAPQCPIPDGLVACCCSGICFNANEALCVYPCSPIEGGANCHNGDVTCPTPPVADLSISKTGPASVAQGEEFDYVITYGNAGPDMSVNVVVRETIPTGVTFVSASNTPGGVAPIVQGSNVTWNVGTLTGGTVNQQVTVRLRPTCTAGLTQINNNTYSIFGSPGGFMTGAVVSTPVTASSSAPIDMVIASVDVNGPPLEADDLIEHTITLTNTANETRSSVRVGNQSGNPISTGNFSTFDSVVDADGGTVEAIVENRTFRWTGNLGPNATVDIVFRTRVDACLHPGAAIQEVLNRGELIAVRNACSQQVGSATPMDAFEIFHPIELLLTATNLGPPAPCSPFGGTFNPIQLARPGQPLLMEMVISNQGDQSENLILSIPIPTGQLADDPPFVGPQPATTTYDSASRTIQFTGTVPAMTSITIAWETLLDIDSGGCRQQTAATGQTAGCQGTPTNNLFATSTILIVPEPSAEPHVIGLDNFRGLWLARPGEDDPFQNLLCLQGEIYTGLDQRSNGEIWFSGLPTVRFNPYTLDLECFTEDFFLNTLGLAPFAMPGPVAYDPADDTLIFTGQTTNGSAVIRFDPETQTPLVVLEESNFVPFARLVVDLDGHIAVLGNQSILRIDPADPASYTELPYSVIPLNTPPCCPTAGASPLDIGLDVDGNYLLLIESFWLSGPNFLTRNWVGKMDRISGDFVMLIDDVLNFSPQATTQRIGGVAVDSSGAIYFGQGPSFTGGRLFGLHQRRLRCSFEYLGQGAVLNQFGERMGVIDLIHNPRITTAGASAADVDQDGLGVCVDNCPSVSNPDQTDSNLNGRGDACEIELVGTLGFANVEAIPIQRKAVPCGSLGMVMLAATLLGFAGLKRSRQGI